jgi:hypothetical protein
MAAYTKIPLKTAINSLQSPYRWCDVDIARFG